MHLSDGRFYSCTRSHNKKMPRLIMCTWVPGLHLAAPQACLCVLLAWVLRLCNDAMSFRPLVPSARTHALHVPIIACKFPGPGASGLKVWPLINLSGWMCGILSLSPLRAMMLHASWPTT